MKQKTFKQFAIDLIPDIKERYDMYKMSPDQLIGKKVISIRSGFSNSGGGQVMFINNADNNMIYLIPCKESSIYVNATTSWQCKYTEKHNSFILYKPE